MMSSSRHSSLNPVANHPEYFAGGIDDRNGCDLRSPGPYLDEGPRRAPAFSLEEMRD